MFSRSQLWTLCLLHLFAHNNTECAIFVIFSIFLLCSFSFNLLVELVGKLGDNESQWKRFPGSHMFARFYGNWLTLRLT